MEIKRIKEKSIHDAIQKVREELGPEAVILSTDKNRHGVEIIAALDFDASVLEQKLAEQNDQSLDAKSVDLKQTTECITGELANHFDQLMEKHFSQHMQTVNQAVSQLQADLNEHSSTIYNVLNNKIEELHASIEEKYLEQQRARVVNFKVLQTQLTQLRDDFGDYVTSTIPNEMNSILQIQEELGDLKDVLGCQTKLLDWEQWGKNNPLGVSLISRLVHAGFGVGLSKQVMSNISDVSNMDAAWSNVIELLTSGIKTPKTDIQQLGGVVMVMGRTGVGKTTTLAKIATQYVIENGPQDVAFINLDDKRVGSFDQLDTYGKILNIPVYRYDGEENSKYILQLINKKKLVLIDTAGMTEPNDDIKKFISYLHNHNINLHKLLLMSANTQLHNLKEMVASFEQCQPNGCVITKTDETSQLGNVLTVSIEDDLPIYFETFGQQVPEDFSSIDPENLIQRAIEDYKHEEMYTSDDDGVLIQGLNRNGISD